MVELDLNREEKEVLVDLLETRLADLRMEIGRTDRMDYRDVLKSRRRVLEKTITLLRNQSVAPGGPADEETFPT